MMRRGMLVLGMCLVAAFSALADEGDGTGFPDKAVILFQGDSITDGNRGRSLDPNHIHGHGYVYLIASDLGAHHPEKDWVFYNRGVSGDTVERLAARWEKDTYALKPDVLSIFIGVNDFGQGVAPEDYRERYDALLKDTLEKLPNVKLFLLEPVQKRKTGESLARFQKFQQIVRELAEKYHAVFVPLQADFDRAFDGGPHPEYWMWDGCHPTTAGHWIIYQNWLKAARKN